MAEQTTSSSTPSGAAQGPAAPHIAERGMLVAGVRLATAMSDAPRALLARAPLVVLPSPGFVWRDYESVLKGFAGERRVFALDWPGFGASDAPPASDFAYTLEHYGELFSAWLDTVGIARGVLLANGLAAIIALRFAAAHPRRVAGLALVSPHGFAAPGLTTRLTRWATTSTSLLRLTWPLATSLLLGPTTTLAAPVAERHRQMRSAPAHATAIAAHAALWRTLPSLATMAATAKSVTAPAAVIRGALDPIVTAADARRAAEATGDHGALEITLPGAGHLPFLQQPDRFFAALTGVLNTAEVQALGGE
jgi:pimeloyl-ACP methyl ester carboxylesterase